MEPPSSRELELETLLRQRDTQLSALTAELTHLRESLLAHPGPSTDPVTLPPALVSVLSPHLHVAPPTASGAPQGSNTVNAALIQRARMLQEENNELYDLLKFGETGKLKEEVRGLRRVVARLEGALRESHQAITTLSNELDKSHSTLLVSARPSTSTNNSAKSISQSPRAAYHVVASEPSTNGPSAKLPPTGPRAYKKPRLADAPAQGQGQQRAQVGGAQHNKTHGRGSAREYVPPGARRKGVNSYHKMEVDEDQRGRMSSVERERERDRERDRERERERERGERGERGGREREREGHGRHRRNGPGGGGGGGRNAFSGRGSRTGHDHGQASSSANDSAHSGDRTLRERMGL